MSSQWTQFFASRRGIILAGGIIGIIGSLLQKLGNPPNMGICVACFERDIAGALGLHRTAVVQYIRPEIIGFVIGSLISALIFKEFKVRSGSAPIVRFILGVFAMIGALAFLGCPWRAVLRLAGGDLNAVIGIAGLCLGVAIGVQFLKSGYNLGRSYKNYTTVGWVFPLLMIGLLLLLIFRINFSLNGPIFFSSSGPGSLHASLFISLGAGLLIGFLAQRTRFCTMGAIRDVILMKEFHLLTGVITMLVMAFILNIVFGQFHVGIQAQPVAHSNYLWNFLGMLLAGLAFALAGGCPGRQLFLAGEGNGDSAIFVIGMITGAAFAHNFGLAGKPDKIVDGILNAGGVSVAGMVAVILGIIVCLTIGFSIREKS